MPIVNDDALADRRKYALAQATAATAIALLRLVETARTSRARRTADLVCEESSRLQQTLRLLQEVFEAEPTDPRVYADGRPVSTSVQLPPPIVRISKRWFHPLGRVDAFGIDPIGTFTYVWHFDPKHRSNTPHELGGTELPTRLYGHTKTQWGSVDCATQVTAVVSAPGELVVVPAYDYTDRFEQMRLMMAARQRVPANPPAAPTTSDRFEQMRLTMAARHEAASAPAPDVRDSNRSRPTRPSKSKSGQGLRSINNPQNRGKPELCNKQ